MTQQIAQLIDHTLLKPEANREAIIKLCEEAKQYQFKSVCVNPTWVKLAKETLKNSTVKICTVIGFPLGANTTETKAFEAKNAIENGASEIDMVINIGAVKSQDYATVENDIKGVVDAARQFPNIIVKVILETCLLTNDEKEKVCPLCAKAGADFVKTSTGFSTGGATIADVELMKKTIPANMQVKASGSIRDLNDLDNMVKAGATRIGTSGGIAILSNVKIESGGY